MTFDPNKIPSIEAIQYGRHTLNNHVVWLKETAKFHARQGRHEMAQNFLVVADHIEKYLLGRPNLIRNLPPFSERYYDPEFRAECEAYF